MRQAIDYNALGWIRKELGETLRQARLQLEEYARGEHGKEFLQSAAAHLHQARGPLQMVNLKGADLLACEMEEAIADLLLESAAEPDTLLELLMQGFLELPDYLSSLRSGSQDNPAALFPLVNRLRMNRGLEPMHAEAVFDPHISARMPRSVFDLHARPAAQDLTSLARAARLRFQTGLLEWYRGNEGGTGLRTLVEVLDHLQQTACSEPAARIWWVGAGMAELLRDGVIEETAELKRLFGQLDRSIKRLMDRGESVFDDPLTDTLLKSLLFQVASAERDAGRTAQIRATYGLEPADAATPEAVDGQAESSLSAELLQTVSGNTRNDIERIKIQVDSYQQEQDPALLPGLVNELHALANTLDMVGMQALARALAGEVEQLRARAGETGMVDADALSTLAATLVVVEDALAELGENAGPESLDDAAASFNQGRRAVIAAVITDLVSAKEAVSDFLKSSGRHELLSEVPVMLHRIHGGLELLGEERLAEASTCISRFVTKELLADQRVLDEDELDSLADAICSVEFCAEQLAENQYYGDHAMQVAERSLALLGYPVTGHTTAGDHTRDTAAAVSGEPEHPATQHGAEAPAAAEPVASAAAGHAGEEAAVAEATGNAAAHISSQQVLADDADPEIVEIFIEEAADVLAQLEAQVPAWCGNPDDRGLLTELRRGFHTLKGSGRMIGAFAVGEFAWAFENLLNRILDESVPANAPVLELLGRAPAATQQLVARVGTPGSPLSIDVDALALAADAASRGEFAGQQDVASAAAGPDSVAAAHETAVPVDTDEMQEPMIAGVADAAQVAAGAGAVDEVSADHHAALAVLAADADPEIVGIFLEEAAQELSTIDSLLPQWLQQQDPALLEQLWRNFHTLKGSGRMTGALLLGEFCWTIEKLLTCVQEGTLVPGPLTSELLSRVPAALSGLLSGIQDGSAPGQDIGDMMQQARALADGSVTDTPQQVQAEAGSAGERPEEPEQTLLELFRRESAEHLATLEECVTRHDDDCGVSEPLYRSLHTLSGISESAQVPGIGHIAGALYSYFSELYQDGQAAVPAAFAVLDDCVREMKAQHAALPDQVCDETRVASLLARVAALSSDADSGVEAGPGVFGAEISTAAAVTEGGDSEVPEFTEPDEAEAGPDAVAGHDTSGPQGGAKPAAGLPDAGHDEERSARSPEQVADVVESDDAAGAGVAADAYAAMDPELYEIFVEEASEIMDASEGVLRGWSGQRDDRQLMAEFQRHLHTLKGGARMVDIAPIGDLSHHVESLLVAAGENTVAVTDDLFVLLNEAHDRLADMLERVKSRQPLVAATELENRLEGFLQPAGADVADSATASPAAAAAGVVAQGQPESGAPAHGELHADTVADGDAPAREPVDASATPAVDQPRGSGVEVSPVARMPRRVERRNAVHTRSEQVRVQSEMLDALVNNAGEISIYRTRMEKQVSDYRFNLNELDQTITRLHEQLRQLEMETEAQILYRFEQDADSDLEFDPLELDRYSKLQQLSRSLIESISDLRSLQEIMESTTRDAETLLLQQSRVSTDLQESLIRTRMIPFSGLAPRLRRIVRQSARELGKKVDLQLHGADGEMDRAVIERIIAPLEHMLRNAIAHGIESPEQRRQAGKDSGGVIRIEFDREGPEIVLRIADDGAGLNISAIRARAVERGLLDADARLPESDIMQFVLQTGFSTASEVTQLAGRGVGMDVVSSEVRQLGGSLELRSVAGQGATFTVRLPYTLAINQALLVNAGDETFCVPLGSIEGVVRVYPEELRACYHSEDGNFEYAGNSYHLKHLASLLGCSCPDPGQASGQLPVLLMRIGDKRVGLQVEELLGSREIVIKPLGLQLSMVDGISGATILGDGRVVMILDVASVAHMQPQKQLQPAAAQGSGTDGHLSVMVVDDSITVRKVTTRLLERNGYRVMTAKDGVDAMGLLQDFVPDLMLLDIEMPRMDGFELATHIRNDERLRHVPIIIITSRGGDKHRERARSIGVNEYLGKPYQESDLLDSIHGILGMRPASAGGSVQ